MKLKVNKQIRVSDLLSFSNITSLPGKARDLRKYVNARLPTAAIDHINNFIKINLLLYGKAVIGQTNINNKAYLKFTLLNPMTNKEDIILLLDEIKEQGGLLAQQQVYKSNIAPV